jgi:hypothetical protein
MFNPFVMSIPSLVALAGMLAIAPGIASAQSSITIVVPFAAGGTSDVGMRAIANTVEEMGGPRITIENRPGGGGVPAAVNVRDAAPDGRTLFLANYATFVVKCDLDEEFSVRSDQGFPADHDAVHISEHARCPDQPSGKISARAGSAGEEEAGRAVVRFAGYRHHRPSFG